MKTFQSRSSEGKAERGRCQEGLLLARKERRSELKAKGWDGRTFERRCSSLEKMISRLLGEDELRALEFDWEEEKIERRSVFSTLVSLMKGGREGKLELTESGRRNRRGSCRF